MDDTFETVLNALRELKSAVEPFVSNDDGMFDDDEALQGRDTLSIDVSADELKRACEAWRTAVGVVGRIDRPAQYRPI